MKKALKILGIALGAIAAVVLVIALAVYFFALRYPNLKKIGRAHV